jgi:hypothetical protein
VVRAGCGVVQDVTTLQKTKPAARRGLNPNLSMMPSCQCFARRVKRAISNGMLVVAIGFTQGE